MSGAFTRRQCRDGAVVTFTPTATDAVDPTPTVSATPASGSTMPLGDTLVQVSASDAHGNAASCEFLVTVRDPNAPMLTCPGDQTATATEASGVAVNYPDPTTQDPGDPMPLINENHISGDTFPIGTTTVQVTATNRSGLSSSCRFKVTVTSNVMATPSHCGCDSDAGALLALLALVPLTSQRRARQVDRLLRARIAENSRRPN